MTTAHLPEARVWRAYDDNKWYYRIDDGPAIGPFDTAVEVGREARAKIVALAEERERQEKMP